MGKGAPWPRGVIGLLVLLVAIWLPGCGEVTPQVVPTPVTGLLGRLDDEVRDLPGERIAWSTYWTLCWRAYPDATRYELQLLTGEGRSRQYRQQHETCVRVEAAAGENARAAGLLDRDLLVRLQTGQLAYRVRAVLPGNRVSEWSTAVAVGETGAR